VFHGVSYFLSQLVKANPNPSYKSSLSEIPYIRENNVHVRHKCPQRVNSSIRNGLAMGRTLVQGVLLKYLKKGP